MTTLEVVEAVQRSLENEGFLQLIRAQLRSNVLRIISSGPEYSPQTGKSVELSHRQQGVIALQLVRQLLEQYNLRESLAVLEAEAGLNEENYLDRRSLKDKLNIHTADDESVLEGLVVSALQSREKRNDANDVQQSLQDRADVVYPASVDVPAESKDDDLDSVPEEESVVEEEEDDVAYSQIEDRDTVESREQSRVSSAASSPVKAVAASKDDGDSPLQLDAKHLSPLNSSGAKSSSPTPPALHPRFHGHGSKQLDVSSSFEADSPARSQASHVAQQKMNAVVLEDSFAEEPEEEDEEFSVEEEIEEEEVEEREDSMAKEEDEREEKELAKAVSPAMSPDRDTKRDDSRSLSGKEEEGEEQGPEYDSDHSSHSAAEAKEMSQERAQIGHKGDSSKHSDSDSSVESAGGKAAPSSLRPAVADDFDPTDRSAADHSLSSSSSNRNRVAVRRAAMEAAESKNSADSNAPGAKANVFRLGQSSISRSQLGWGSETSAHAVDDDRSEDEEDDDEFAATEKGARNGGGTATATANARYTSTSQMEAVSFDTDEDDGDRPSPVRAEPRRSNNQESESEGEHDRRDEDKVKNKGNNSSRESAHSADFEAEDDSEGDVSFGDDEDVLPSVGKGVPARTAFGSPPTKSTSRAEKEEEDEGDDADEYGDDDFVEDEEEEEENEPQQKPVQRQAPTTGGGLFSTRAGTVPSKALPSNHDDEDEEEEEGSVEEEIEEEVEEDMSVGDMDSDEDDDGGFGSPVQAKKKVNQQQQQSLGDGLFRAGRSGPLPGVSSVAATKGKASHFDSILNSDDSSDSEGESNRKGSAGVSKRGASSGPGSSITDRMREIDSQLEELEHDDPHLAKLKNHSDDENSVASEDIDAMEFSTGGGQDNDSESSGEGSFSFLDASTKK